MYTDKVFDAYRGGIMMVLLSPLLPFPPLPSLPSSPCLESSLD